MNYESALKEVRATKAKKENFMVIRSGYDSYLVLPYDAGVQYMACLKQAEKYEESYPNAPRISGIDLSDMSVRVMSAQDYELTKISALLRLNREEHKAMLDAHKKTTKEEDTE